MTATNPGPCIINVRSFSPAGNAVADDNAMFAADALTPLNEWLDSDAGRAWLADRGIFMPPLPSEAIAWLEAHPGKRLEVQDDDSGKWSESGWDQVDLAAMFNEHGDYRMHGYGIPVAPPEPEVSIWAASVAAAILDRAPAELSPADLAAIAKAVTDAQQYPLRTPDGVAASQKFNEVNR